MGHEKLIEALSQETAVKAEEIVRDARNKAEEIIKSAESEKTLQLKSLNENAAGEIRSKNLALKNSAASSLRGMENSLKVSCIDKVLIDAVAGINNLPEDQLQKVYSSLLEGLIAESKSFGAGKFYVSDAVIGLVQEYARQKDITLISDSNISGFLYVSDDRTISARSSIETVVEAVKPSLVVELKEMLF